MTYYPPRPPADHGAEHPGMANYPSDETPRRPRRHSVPSSNRWLPPLDEQHTAAHSTPDDAARPRASGSPSPGQPPRAAAKWVPGCTVSYIVRPPPTAPTSPG
nr:hypothetical protein [Mycolicibacterium boenickei]